MTVERIRNHDDYLIPLVNSEIAWRALEKYIDERLDAYYKFVINEEDTVKLYRTQGRIRELLDLKHLKQRVG